ncbi:hypothetical protein [Caldifermentibacillus hisashii]|uniref:hypothetical protein n=1 Tax=Caldifermentibacillus hisashii TaxID=996558 RepID=UPI0030E8A09E
MVTRKVLVVKKWGFPAQNGDENGLRRQKIGFSGSKWRREKVSSPKKGVSHPKVTTRMGFVAKKESFPAQNGDEKRSRRQKMGFPGSKWRREWASSPKKGVFRLKMVTRKGLIVKKWSFAPQNGDEKRSRSQKMRFHASKW